MTSIDWDLTAHLEFLEYLAPRDGRPMPVDEKANDLIHWQTTLVTTDATAMIGRLRAGKFVFVSPGVIEMSGSSGSSTIEKT